MTDQEERSIVAAYSEGRIRRAEMLERLGLENSIAETFRLLAKHDLKLPSYPGKSSPEATALLRLALARKSHAR